jgi:hypothetical protein
VVLETHADVEHIVEPNSDVGVRSVEKKLKPESVMSAPPVTGAFQALSGEEESAGESKVNARCAVLTWEVTVITTSFAEP